MVSFGTAALQHVLGRGLGHLAGANEQDAPAVSAAGRTFSAMATAAPPQLQMPWAMPVRERTCLPAPMEAWKSLLRILSVWPACWASW